MREPNFRGASELPPEEGDQRRQAEVRRLFEQLPLWVRDGRMVQGSLKDAGEASVSHGLKRAVKGWMLVAPSGDADRVAVVQTGSDSSVVKLKNVGASGSLAFSLWVF